MKNIQVFKNGLRENPYTRENIMRFEGALNKIPEAVVSNAKGEIPGCEYIHSFVDGAYVRQMILPKNMFFVTMIHKKTHPFFILKGDVTVISEEGGRQRIKAPFHGITLAGTKRAIFTHKKTIWVTVHVTEKTDIEEIRKDVIAESFDDPDLKEIKNLEVVA